MSFKLFTKHKNSFDLQSERLCENCGEKFKGRFCNVCGEKIVEPNERTIKHFLGHIFNAFTFIDGKFLNSIKSLVFNPGGMSKDISQGKSKPYMRPIGLFFVGNLIYFLFPVFETFNSSLYSQMDYMSYSELFSIRSMVETRIEKENIEMEIFAEKYGTKSTSHSKTFLIVWVAILTVFISLIHFSKKKLFSDHLLFSVELICFILHILTIAVGFLLFLIFKLTKQNYMDDSVIVFIYIPALAYFLFRSIKKFYGTSTVVAAFKSAASLIIVVLSIECYRLFLFMLTMYTL